MENNYFTEQQVAISDNSCKCLFCLSFACFCNRFTYVYFIVNKFSLMIVLIFARLHIKKLLPQNVELLQVLMNTIVNITSNNNNNSDDNNNNDNNNNNNNLNSNTNTGKKRRKKRSLLNNNNYYGNETLIPRTFSNLTENDSLSGFNFLLYVLFHFNFTTISLIWNIFCSFFIKQF